MSDTAVEISLGAKRVDNFPDKGTHIELPPQQFEMSDPQEVQALEPTAIDRSIEILQEFTSPLVLPTPGTPDSKNQGVERIREELDGIADHSAGNALNDENSYSGNDSWKVLKKIEELTVVSDEDVEQLNTLVDSVCMPLRRRVISALAEREGKKAKFQKQEKQFATRLQEAGFASIEELEMASDVLWGEIRSKRNKFGRLGRFTDRAAIARLTSEQVRLRRIEDLRPDSNLNFDSDTAFAPYPDYQAESVAGTAIQTTIDTILQFYRGSSHSELEGKEARYLDNKLVNDLEDEFIRQVVISKIPPRHEYREGMTDGDVMESAISLLRDELRRPLMRKATFHLTSEEEAQVKARNEVLYALPSTLRYAVGDVLNHPPIAGVSFEDLAAFVDTFPEQVVLENQRVEAIAKLYAISSQEMVPKSMRQNLRSQLSEEKYALKHNGTEKRLYDLVNGLDIKRWKVFRENTNVQTIFGADKLQDADELFGNTAIEQLFRSIGDQNAALDVGVKLFGFIHTDTLPIIILNAYRETGGSGEFPFLDIHNNRPDAAPLYKAVTWLSEQQLKKIIDSPVPGLTRVVNLIKDKSEGFGNHADPSYQHIMDGLSEMVQHYFAMGDESMQPFLIGTAKLIDSDLGSGYEALAGILLDPENPNHEQIVGACLHRVYARSDWSAASVLVQDYDKLTAENQERIRDVAPMIFSKFVQDKDYIPKIFNKLGEVLNMAPEELRRTFTFAEALAGLTPDRQFEPSYFEDYVEMAKIPDMLPFVKKLATFGYGFSASHRALLENLQKNQDGLFGELERIRGEFPHFSFNPYIEYMHGDSRMIADPHEMLILKNFKGAEGVIRGITYLDSVPPQHTAFATETLIRNSTTLLASTPPEQAEALFESVFDFIHSRQLGDAKIPVYDALIALAGTMYSQESIFYTKEVVGDGIHVQRPNSISDETIDELIAGSDQQKLFAFIYNFTDTYRYNLDSEYFEKNIQRAHGERDISIRLLGKISDPKLRELATIRLYEYLLDPDLGNLQLAEQVLSEVTGSEVKAHLASVHAASQERYEKGVTRYAGILRDVDLISPTNREELTKTLDFDKESKQQQLTEEVRKVQDTMHVSINLRLESLLMILKADRRFKTSWDTSHRGGHYDTSRDIAERRMGIRAKGTRHDPHPTYGAVWSANARDMSSGATGGRYGETFVLLKNDRIKQRTTFTYDDSFNPRARSLNWEDAQYAKAMTNLTDGPYIEAQILGGLTIDDIESVTIPFTRIKVGIWGDLHSRDLSEAEIKKVSEEIEDLRQRFPDITFINPNIADNEAIG